MTANQLSEKLLLAVKMQNPTNELVAVLRAFPIGQLEKELANDTQKKAFWINCYNAFFQILRKEKNLVKPEIYREKHSYIAGQKLSLDDMEHGILRKYWYKYSLGFLPNLFAGRTIKKWAVDEIDYRIHFALNCGAESCPPIAFYHPNRLEQQLDMATLSFLEGETDVFLDKKEIHVTRLFQWFLADFGGMAGVRQILQDKLNIDTNDSKIVFKAYSWKEELDNFVSP